MEGWRAPSSRGLAESAQFGRSLATDGLTIRLMNLTRSPRNPVPACCCEHLADLLRCFCRRQDQLRGSSHPPAAQRMHLVPQSRQEEGRARSQLLSGDDGRQRKRPGGQPGRSRTQACSLKSSPTPKTRTCPRARASWPTRTSRSSSSSSPWALCRTPPASRDRQGQAEAESLGRRIRYRQAQRPDRDAAGLDP